MTTETRKVVAAQTERGLILRAALAYLAEHPELGRSEKIAFQCEVARRLDKAGDNDGAQEILSDVWDGPGTAPRLDGLDEKSAAHVLLRAGYVTYRVGAVKLRRGLYEASKNLFSEAQRRCAATGDAEAEAEAVIGLAQCAWRLGDGDSAKLLLHGVMDRLRGSGSEQLCYAVILLGNVEWSDDRAEPAVALLTSHANLFHDGRGHSLLGRYRAALGQGLHLAGRVAEALEEHRKAGHHFELAGDLRQSARMDNNVGCALATAGRHEEAAEFFDRAREKFTVAGDPFAAAFVDDSEAQSCIAQRLYPKAQRLAARAESKLDESDHAAPLVETLTTYGRALSREGRLGEGCLKFERAYEIAMDRLGTEAAERVREAYREEILVALFSEPGMTYHTARRTLERSLIRRALLESGGNQRKAAFNLGMKQQALNQLLRSTHKEILDELGGRQLPARSRVTTK